MPFWPSKTSIPSPKKPPSFIPQASSSKEEPPTHFEPKALAVFPNDDHANLSSSDSSKIYDDSSEDSNSQEQTDAPSLLTSACSYTLANITNLP